MRWILRDVEYETALRRWSVDPENERSFHVRRHPYGLRIAKLRQLVEALHDVSSRPLNFLGGKEVGEGPYDMTVLTYAAEEGSPMHLTAQRLAVPLPLSAITVEPGAQIEEIGDGIQLVLTGERHLSGVLARADGEAIISSAYGKLIRPANGEGYEHVPPPLTPGQLRRLLLHLAAQDLAALHSLRPSAAEGSDDDLDW